jgi:cell division protein FtsZ
MLNDKYAVRAKERDYYLKEEENENEALTKIKVVGIGGAGCNAVNRMIEEGITNVEFIAVNTDAQVLRNSLAKNTLQIGSRSTKGLGAGAKPEVGEKAAQEDIEEIKKVLDKANMVFITAGMGGGTGTGAAPVFAKVAKDMGALTVAVVTIPFDFEGKRRIEVAYAGIEKLKEHVDTMLVISNSRIFKVIERKAGVKQAFHKIDDVLKQAVQGISSIITDVGIINVDFADVRTVLSNRGEAIMGIGSSSGESRAIEAARMALENPLIENSSFKNSGAMLVNIIGGPDFAMAEYDEAAKTIAEYCREDAEIIVGLNVEDNLKDKVRIIIIATDFRESAGSIENETVPIPAESIFEERKVVSLAEIRQERNRQRIQNNPGMNAVKPVVRIMEEDYETPAFLRRRKMG